MPKTVTVLDTDVDPLWGRHLPRATSNNTGNGPAHSQQVISLRAISAAHYPHRHNVFGWRRWLKQNDIQELRCYLPGRNSRAILSAALLASVPVSLYITRHLKTNEWKKLKLWKHRTERVYCPGNGIRQQLMAQGIAADKISVDIPDIQRSSVRKTDLVQYKRRLKLPENARILLSLAPPQDHMALLNIIWTAAMVKHVFNNTHLIVSGACTREDRSRLADWQRGFNTPDLLRLHPMPQHWDRLTQVCDLVLAGCDCDREVIRLRYAQAAGKPIVGAGIAFEEYTHGYENALPVHPPKPRQFAAAVLNQIQETAT